MNSPIRPRVYFGRNAYYKQSDCPSCGNHLDGITRTGFEAKADFVPKPGDFSICMYCATVLRFEAGAKLRVATTEDLRQMRDMQPKEFELMQKLVWGAEQGIHQRRHKPYRKN